MRSRTSGRRDGARAAADGRRPRLLRGPGLADRAVAPGEAPVDLGASIERNYKPLVLGLRALPLPVVCAVNGVAAGAGANIALACDIVIAARSASFIQAFCKIGLIPDSGGTYFLPRLVGSARAMGLALLGDKLSAEQAAEWGLIWQCVDDARAAGRRRQAAEQFAQAPTRGLAAIKQALHASAGNTLAAQLDLERDLQRDAREERRLSRRGRCLHREAAAEFHRSLNRQLADAMTAAVPKDATVAVIGAGRWAPASRRSPRSTATASSCTTRGWAPATPRRSSIARIARQAGRPRAGSRRADAEAALARIATVVTLPDVCVAQLVIEAIVEDLAAKRELFERVENVVDPRVHPRVEHVVDLDHGACRGHEASRSASSACTSSIRRR